MSGAATDVFSLRLAIITIRHKATPDGVYVEDIVASFGARSHYFLILFFSLPFLQPIPLLGLSSILGPMIALFGITAAIGQRPWLPQRLLRRHLKPNLVESICLALEKFLQRSERVVKPRYPILITHQLMRFLNAALIALSALLLALPLPIPFSNLVPAYFLVVNAVACLEGDGLLVLFSYVLAAGGVLFFMGISTGIWKLLAL